MDKQALAIWFAFFNEIGIINQLSNAAFELRLSDGLQVSHFSVLNHLIRVEDGRTPLSIAKAFQVPKTTMSHTLAGLEKRGLVTFRPNPDDARSKLVWLTDKGRKTRDDAIAALVPDLSDLATSFSLDQIEEILPHLEAIRKYMDEARNEL